MEIDPFASIMNGIFIKQYIDTVTSILLKCLGNVRFAEECSVA